MKLNVFSFERGVYYLKVDNDNNVSLQVSFVVQ